LAYLAHPSSSSFSVHHRRSWASGHLTYGRAHASCALVLSRCVGLATLLTSSASKKAFGTRQDIPVDLSLPSHTHPCCCRRKTAVQLQTVSLPTPVIICLAAVRLRSRAQLASASRAVLVLGRPKRTQSSRAGALGAGISTVAAPPRSPALARLPGSAREINCRCSVHHVSSQVVLSAAIVSAQLVSVRRRRRRLEDTCAQRGGACPTNEPGVGVGCSFAGLWVVGGW